MQFNRILIILSLSFLFIACKSNSELTMERGIYFYEIGDYNASANQFNKIILSYQYDTQSLSANDIEILAQAYQQLALCQAKLASQSNDFVDKKLHYENALNNIKKAENFAIRPNKREEYRKTYLGILKKINNYEF